MGPLELARWVWRQLTSMRTALILLFLLALASIPGSVVPQEAVDSLRASQWRDQHPELTPIYEQLGLFSVYNSVWFSAIYILLVISLVGCFLPRMRVYWRGVRARPPGAPRHLSRMPQHRTFETDEAPEVTLERAQAWLKRKHFRVAADDRHDAGAERGYLREAGNLLFHVSVLIVLVGFAVGGLWGFKGGVTVVTKDGFANTLSQYDDFRAGTLFDPAELDPFDFTVDDFAVTFIREGREAGMAHEFAADLTYRTSPGAAEKKRKISVNHPLTIDDTDVFLISHGYAPHITVRNADRSVAFSGPVVFLPEDSTFRSFGVVKVPDARQEEGTRTPSSGSRASSTRRTASPRRAGRSPPSPTSRTRRCRCSPGAATSVSTPGRRSRSTRCRRRAWTRSGTPRASRCVSTSPWAAPRGCPTASGRSPSTGSAAT